VWKASRSFRRRLALPPESKAINDIGLTLVLIQGGVRGQLPTSCITASIGTCDEGYRHRDRVSLGFRHSSDEEGMTGTFDPFLGNVYSTFLFYSPCDRMHSLLVVSITPMTWLIRRNELTLASRIMLRLSFATLPGGGNRDSIYRPHPYSWPDYTILQCSPRHYLCCLSSSPFLESPGFMRFPSPC
jgi:hypothetical protein